MSEYNRQEQLKQVHEERRARTDKKANEAIDLLLLRKEPINFKRVSEVSGVSISTLYKHEAVRRRIDDLRGQIASLPSSKDLKTDMDNESKDAVIASLKRKVDRLEKENKKLKSQLDRSLAEEWESL